MRADNGRQENRLTWNKPARKDSRNNHKDGFDKALSARARRKKTRRRLYDSIICFNVRGRPDLQDCRKDGRRKGVQNNSKKQKRRANWSGHV